MKKTQTFKNAHGETVVVREGDEGWHARPNANGGMGSGTYLLNHTTGKSEWVADAGDWA